MTVVDALCGGGGDDDYNNIRTPLRISRPMMGGMGRGGADFGVIDSKPSNEQRDARTWCHAAEVLIIFSEHMIRVYFVPIDIIINSSSESVIRKFFVTL